MTIKPIHPYDRDTGAWIDNRPPDMEELEAAEAIFDGIQDGTAEQRLADALVNIGAPKTAATLAKNLKEEGIDITVATPVKPK